jgi:hypothetical protein
MIKLSTAMQAVANMKRNARTPQRKEKTLRAGAQNADRYCDLYHVSYHRCYVIYDPTKHRDYRP